MRRLIALVILALALGGGGLALAATAPAAPPAAPSAAGDGWQPVDGDMMAKGETIPAARLVGAAYGFIFAAVVVWVASVARRARRLEDEVAALQKKLDAAAGAGGARG